MSGSIHSVEEKLIKFLEETEEDFLSLWKESIILREDDIFKDRVSGNGHQMYLLVKKSLKSSIKDEEIKELAYKVAKERVLSKSNIGEFVYNVNVGRSTVIKYIIKSGISIDDLQPIINRINDHFDRYCYHAVTRYTELKDIEIKEKMVFVNQSHKDRLSLLGQMSSSFVHEFRNPLTSVMGFVKLLKNENPALKYMDTIEHELDQLKFRITQFLHASKLEVADKNKEEILVKKLFDEITAFLYPSIVDGDVKLSMTIDPTCTIVAVKDEIKQVLVNIILNSIDALKHNNSIDRKLCIKSEAKQGSILFNITNNGPEIPEETKEAIFEPFYTTKSLGTGIGLYVCKSLIEKHNGTIYCESYKNKTSFIITLPINEKKPTVD
ncbi:MULTISPECIES: histidine kinase N-terminal domain-containing protein [Bacillaceae]|uniref:histidine kinase N-terminal domain-containing protein n=1 Tax=Bacillaceae TaxID=186817 RepID=UPI00159BD0ED|nr:MULTISPECIES: histidine kinase N-terminal domain-containing protein [Bacillaceae]UGB33437.1 ATP-binding protein [Metabacillus sp. B2-18]